LTIDGLPGECFAAAMLRAASDPSRRAGLYDLLGIYCHQFRNLLNCMKLALYLAKRAGGNERSVSWSDLDRPYIALERLLDRLQAIVRPMRLTLTQHPLSMLIDERRPAWAATFSKHGRTLETIAPTMEAVVSFDVSQLGLALDALVQWRAEAHMGGTPVIIRWGVVGSDLDLEWFEPAPSAGESFAEQSDELALPLLGRVASAHGGALSIDTRDGLRLGLRWPADPTPMRE
jgi:hypothetical protein